MMRQATTAATAARNTKTTATAVVTKKLVTLVVSRLIDVFFQNYANSRLRYTTMEKIVATCEHYKVFTMAVLFTQQEADTRYVARGILSVIVNPWYDRLMNFFAIKIAQNTPKLPTTAAIFHRFNFLTSTTR